MTLRIGLYISYLQLGKYYPTGRDYTLTLIGYLRTDGGYSGSITVRRAVRVYGWLEIVGVRSYDFIDILVEHYTYRS